MKSVHSKEYKIFLRRLYHARIQSGLTQSRVAELLGKPQSFISKCEQGERVVNVIDLYKFSKIYDKSLNYFFEEGEDE